MFSLTALQTRPDLPVAPLAPWFAPRTSGAKMQSTQQSFPLACDFSPNLCSARAFLRNPLVVVRKSALIKPRFCHAPKFCSRGCSPQGARFFRVSFAASDVPVCAKPRLHFFWKIAMLVPVAPNSLTEQEDLFYFSMPRSRSSILCIFFLFFFGVRAVSADDISKISPTGYVTDLAGVIPQATQQRLEALGTELEQKTGAQMAIVTVKSLDGRPVEDYAVDLFKHLGVGSKKESSGVLLLLAPNDRKYRIEVGYGIEPIINDARAGDAGRAMVPFLKQNDFGSAVEVAAWQLAKFIAGEKGLTLSGQPPARPISSSPHRGTPINPVAILFILFIVFRVFGAAIANTSGARSGRGFGGCWWLLPFLMSGGGGRGGGGSSWGGGGGFGGGGGGFGGFGGGSSGGGGASGSW